MFERELRDLSFVPRWVTARQIKGQTLDSHHYFVAIYSLQIVQWLELASEADLVADVLQHALTHDLGEMVSGDIPGPWKRAAVKKDAEEMTAAMVEQRIPQLQVSLPQRHVVSIVKVADIFDEVFYLCTEEQLGNGAVEGLLNHSIKRLRVAWDNLTLAETVNLQMGWGKYVVPAIEAHRRMQSKIMVG